MQAACWKCAISVPEDGQTDRQVDTHPARVALQELDLLVELDVVSSQVVQLALQGVHRVLQQPVLLPGVWRDNGIQPGFSPSSGAKPPGLELKLLPN